MLDRQPVLVAADVATPPTIDGEVDHDPVWAALPSVSHTDGAWTQLARKEVSGRQTVVYSCHDATNVYFGFVCEEPELHNLRMDGVLTQDFQPAGPDDSVEVIIEVGGMQGDGQVYSFRANLRARRSAWGLNSIPPNLGHHVPRFKSAGKFGPNRWMLEMAIPFAELKRRPEHKGLAAPPRGDVWAMKLVRWGAQQLDPKNRMVSTWNTDIVFTTPYIAGANGLLYFGDADTLVDGDFSLAPDQSPWKRDGNTLTQTATVQRLSYYVLRVETGGKAVPEVAVDGRKLDLKNGTAGFWTQDKDEAVVALRGAPAKRVSMEYQPGEEPAGSYCLTDNYRHPERNIRAILPDAPEGRYQYVKLDFQNRTIGDDNPAIDPRYWGVDFNTRMPDVGGTNGWIPFRKGSLTGRPEFMMWNCVLLDEPAYTYGVKVNQVLEIDLGQEYYVRGLDVLWLAANAFNFELWGKVNAEDEWSLLHMDDGQFVEPFRRRGGFRAYESVRGLDSTVRYVRWRCTQEPRWSKCIDGIQEMWVWGEPKGAHSGIKPFQPWIPNEGAAPVKWTTTAPDPEACQIVPRPRKMETTNGWFVIGPQTRIMAQADPQARKVAKQIQEEIHARWQIEVPVAEEPADAGASPDDVIYVGQPKLGPLAERLRQEEGLAITNRPQAYALRSSSHRVVVLGHDAEGLYWGAQSLMLAMRWHSSEDPKENGLGLRHMKVEDWPATLERSMFWSEHSLFESYIPSEIPRLMETCRLQTRFKWNAQYTVVDGAGASWPTGLVAKVSQDIRERYHMEIRPMLLGTPSAGAREWYKLVQASKATRLVERNPDEAPNELGIALNLCPVNPGTYDLIFARIDELQSQYGWPGKIWLGELALPYPDYGSRWAVCRNCQESGKSKDELLSLFAARIAQHLRDRQMTGVVGPEDVAFGDRHDPRWKRATVVSDVKSLPGDLEYILPDDTSQRFKAFIGTNLVPARTANGPLDWPSVERICSAGMGTDLATAGAMSGGLASALEAMWYGSEKPPNGRIDLPDMCVWGNAWHFRRDLPSWRAGDRPAFFPINLRPFVNHTGQATGMETLETGRMPAIDLRYLPAGRQVLSGVEFDILAPAQNNGKSLLMLGRPPRSITHAKDMAAVIEGAGPIPVGRKLASLAFLRAGWLASPQWDIWNNAWLFPACRVVYDDETWSLVDCFRPWDPADWWNNGNWAGPHLQSLMDRIGWMGNCPGGSPVILKVNEWVNPYPEKTVKHLQFFTPDYEQGNGEKTANALCQAFIAVTGVEPIEQDLNFWARRENRPPLLPPLRPPAQSGLTLRRVGDYSQDTGGRCAMRLKCPTNEVTSTLEPAHGAGSVAPGWSSADCAQIDCGAEFKPFGVVQTLKPAAELCRVEVRGPMYGYYHMDYSLGRNHRVDVTVEISEDGETWRTAGELKGLAGDAGFLPIEFEPVSVKKLRVTATAAPYHEDYHPAIVRVARGIDYPFFVWRLIAPEDRSLVNGH